MYGFRSIRLHDDGDGGSMPFFKEKSPPFQSWGPSKPQSAVHFHLLPVVYIMTSVAYLASLRGAKSPLEMNSIQGYLAVFLVVAVACFSAQFWLALRSPFFARSCVLQACTVGAWYLFDNGNRLGSHGAYNMLIFVMLLVPTNVVIAIFHVWYRLAKSRRFWAEVVVVGLLLGLLFRQAAFRREKALSYGFFGRPGLCGRVAPHPDCKACQWDTGVPWLDLIPFRLNIFTGPMTCPKDDSFSAYFQGDRLVIEGCQAATDVVSYFNSTVLYSFPGAAYSVLPRTESWGLPLKRDSLSSEQNQFQANVLQYAEEHTSAYRGPTIMKNGFDTVLARCGSAEPKLVHRIGFSAVHEEQDPPTKPIQPGDGALNVVTIFLDAVSRSQFHRSLPATRRTLEHLTAEHATDIFEFFRYHTVGYNTGPNTRALWAGLSEGDHYGAGAPLWEQFEQSGYVSAHINPMCQDWDAYYNPYQLQPQNATSIAPRISHEYLTFSCLPPYLPLGKNANGNFAGAYSLKARCISDTHVGWHTLDWASNFISAYKHRSPYYLHATFMEGHEGSGAVLSTLDARLAAFLDPRTSPIDFATTAVVLLSDHGALMGLKSALFANGRIEAANPAAVILLPSAYAAGHGRAAKLGAATGRLVTAHDLYETIRGFGAPGSNATSRLSAEMRAGAAARGFDLAHDVLFDRTCGEAGITEVPCRCR